ncbi:hypothetical protein, partial [Streptomyces boncukensis]
LVLVTVVLLIAIPAGFLVQQAFRSRESGRDKERAAGATSLVYARPPKVSQRIYDVPVPEQATRIAFYETNAWERSRMWVQFRTSPKRLKEFLRDIDGDSGTLTLDKGRVTIGEGQARKVGWRFDEPGHRYAGTVYTQSGHEPDLAITVDTTYKSRPRVFVVSTAQF